MKKIIAIVVAVSSLFFLTVSNALAEWSIGVSVAHGEYTAEGEENENGEINKKTGAIGVTYPIIFIEKELDYGLSVGLDLIPGEVESEEATRTDYNCSGQLGVSPCAGNDGTTGSITNKAKVGLSRHVSLYALVPITDIGAFARVQIMRVDVETKETLGTGSKYPDTHMTGASLSLGYQHDTDGFFIRGEVGYTDYEGITVQSNTTNKVEVDVDGGWARISIGHTF